MKLTEIKNALDLAAVAKEIFSAFEDSSEARHVSVTNAPFKNGKSLMFDMRDWGDWENPDDAEDEEDYDHQVLTPSSRKAAKELCAAMEKKFPGFKCSFCTGEKNYLEVYVEQKA